MFWSASIFKLALIWQRWATFIIIRQNKNMDISPFIYQVKFQCVAWYVQTQSIKTSRKTLSSIENNLHIAFNSNWCVLCTELHLGSFHDQLVVESGKDYLRATPMDSELYTQYLGQLSWGEEKSLDQAVSSFSRVWLAVWILTYTTSP